MIMAINTWNHDLSHINKSANSTVVISHDKEAQIEGIVMESPESNTDF